MLQDKAMLVNLMVRAWSARKRDKDIGKEVEQNHQATNAGNFNKLLIDKQAMKEINTMCGTLRDTHYKMTLPWGDNGDRLLPSAMYFEYTATMRALRADFEFAVRKFCTGYPAFKQEARKRLGTMYDAEDYPDVAYLPAKFEARVSFTPVPDAKDFRVDLGADEVETIRKDIAAQVARQQEDAMIDLWNRLKETVEHIYNRLSDPEAIFRDSLIENAKFACGIAEKLNITQDNALEKVRIDIETKLCVIQPQRLRDDKVLRASIAQTANHILAMFPK
jgi:hypothetical protein